MRFRSLSLIPLLGALGGLSVFACADHPNEASDASEVKGADDIFAKPEAFELKISAPLSTLWTRFAARQADPPKETDAGTRFPEQEYSEPGQLTFTNADGEHVLDMRVYIRGESSKSDCPFPKLKIDFADKEQLKKTPFKGHGKLRLNTHCGPGDASSRSRMGRVMNGVGPVREELAYRMVRAAGIPTYLTRVVKVHYNDTANEEQIDSFGMFMETGDDAAQRFAKMDPPLIPADAVYLDPREVPYQSPITPENKAEIAVAEAFVGNRDWGGTHNIDSFGVTPNGPIFQIAQDFDLGAIVLGDIAHYGKGSAAVSEGKTGLANETIAKKILAHKDEMAAAYRLAEKVALKAEAVPSTDGSTTTDPGFLEALKRMNELFDMPELGGTLPANDGGAPDAAP